MNTKRMVLFLAVAVSLLAPIKGLAQVGTGTINGIVTDSTGAVIPGATLTITNLATNVKRVAQTNATGNYIILDLLPARYELEVSKTGFQVESVPEFPLEVNQTSTYDFTLKPGSMVQSVTVQAQGTKLQAATATLGTVVSPVEVQDLPLNGRNFTQILDLTPGVSPISVGQNGTGTIAQMNHAIGTFTNPSVNGQPNRSNFFVMDGAHNNNTYGNSYNFPPIVDQIQEFKVESHIDSVETGGVLGGVVDVVTKSGTNQFHGDAWEFVRNNAFDARNTFLATVVPYKQNQFGGTFGGPLILPKFNGRDKTWFFAAYEGYRNHTASTSLYSTATPAELNGDFSADAQQIYNPFSTAPDPNKPGQFLRSPFMCDSSGNPEPATNGIQAAGTACNKIPTSMINSGMLSYAKALFPAPVSTSVAGINGINLAPTITRQDAASLRFDHSFNASNNLWVRYSGYTIPVTANGEIAGVIAPVWDHGYQSAATYTHSIGSAGVVDFTFARDRGTYIGTVTYPSAVANAWQQAGFSPEFAGNFATGVSQNPTVNIAGYLEVGTGTVLNTIPYADTNEWKGDMALTHARHTLKFGGSIQSNNSPECSLHLQMSETFSTINTDNPETSLGGDALASYLLSVPNSATRRSVCESQRGGWVDGAYIQDQWKPTSKLTVNLGFRYDVTLIPIFGTTDTRSGGSEYVGDMDMQNGTYILEAVPPACGNGVGAPCIPGGTLPAHVVLTPLANGRIYHDTYDNWQPRVGLAYRLTPTTVTRASFGRFFDNWAGILQMAQNFEGSWPSVTQLNATNLNLPEPGTPTPTVTAQDPLQLGTSAIVPASTPFGGTNYFANPAIQNPYSDQWNFGVEHQFGNDTVLSVNYVGSESIRTDVGIIGNTAVTPGAGTPQSRAPFTYITPTNYDNSIGRASFNSLEASLRRHTSRGLTYLISYTWSKTMDLGADGWFAAEGTAIQNPYDLNASHSVAGYDLPQNLSANWVYELPFGQGKSVAAGSRVLNGLMGGWKLNGIISLASGQPYNVTANSGIANTGNNDEQANLVGNPSLSHPKPSEWFNTSAFAPPATYTWGNLGRNTLRSNWNKNVDLSLLRDIRIREGKTLEVRCEFFNAFNNVVYAAPSSSVSTSSTFGKVTSIVNTPRQIELAAKFYF